MFKSLYDALRTKNLVGPAVKATDESLALAAQITREATARLFLGETKDVDVYATDKKINAAQIEVRQMVFEHLVANPKTDLVTSVILLSTIIDVERIGDYAKNLDQLLPRLKGAWPTRAPFDEIAGMRDELLQMFEDTHVAMRKGDAKLATAVMDQQHRFGRRCEAIVDIFCNGSDATNCEAVVGTLAVRYLKRISAHLSNLSSGVVNPIDRIGFEPVRRDPLS